ncbi:MAG: helix-turn-helix domain-containing protein [Crocinitomicaceae bacterium]|nr:helix-turn-helix domain-containing protein [Crocinitomicaceae bacterium]
MEIVFIVGAVQAFFLTFMVINKKNKSKADYYLMAMLLMMGFNLLVYAMEVMGIDTDYPILLYLHTADGILIAPLIYLYISSYTKSSQKFSPLVLIHAIPYVFFTVFVFLQFTVNSVGSIDEDKFLIEDSGTTLFFIMGLFRVFWGTIYMIAGLLMLKKHSINIRKQFSYTENIDLKWLRNVVYMMIAIWVTVIIINLLSNFNRFIDYRIGDNIIQSIVTIVVFLLGYYGIKQQMIFAPTVKVEENSTPEKPKPSTDSNEPKKQYEKSGLSKEDSESHLQRLQDYMTGEQPYADGKLSLKEVAEYLDISPNHLSQVINENLNKNFFDFVNGYRVDLVKEKMLDSSNKNFTLLGIAYDSGFNSKSSFNSIFKKITGLTPTNYINQEVR